MKQSIIQNMQIVLLQVVISLQAAMLEQVMFKQQPQFMLTHIIGITMVRHLAVQLIVIQMLVNIFQLTVVTQMQHSLQVMAII